MQEVGWGVMGVRLVAEVVSITEVDGEEKVDEYGLIWKRFKRQLKIVGKREFNRISEDLPNELKGKIVEQEVWLCTAPEYEWHFTTKLGEKPLLITLSEEESKEILKRMGIKGP